MKKYIFLFIFVICLSIFVSCAGNIGNGETEATYDKAGDTTYASSSDTASVITTVPITTPEQTSATASATVNIETTENTSILTDDVQTTYDIPKIETTATEKLTYSVDFPGKLRVYYPYYPYYKDVVGKLECTVGKYVSDYPGKYPVVNVKECEYQEFVDRAWDATLMRDRYIKGEISYMELKDFKRRQSLAEMRNRIDVYMNYVGDKVLLNDDINELAYYLDTYLSSKDIAYGRCTDEQKNTIKDEPFDIRESLYNIERFFGGLMETEMGIDQKVPKSNSFEVFSDNFYEDKRNMEYYEKYWRITPEDVDLFIKIFDCAYRLIGDYSDLQYVTNHSFGGYYTAQTAKYYFSPKPIVTSHYDGDKDVTVFEITSPDVSYFICSDYPEYYRFLGYSDLLHTPVTRNLNKGYFEIEGKYSGYFYVCKVDDNGVISYNYEYEIAEGVTR